MIILYYTPVLVPGTWWYARERRGRSRLVCVREREIASEGGREGGRERQRERETERDRQREREILKSQCPNIFTIQGHYECDVSEFMPITGSAVPLATEDDMTRKQSERTRFEGADSTNAILERICSASRNDASPCSAHLN